MGQRLFNAAGFKNISESSNESFEYHAAVDPGEPGPDYLSSHFVLTSGDDDTVLFSEGSYNRFA